jgi:hypothetical protein
VLRFYTAQQFASANIQQVIVFNCQNSGTTKKGSEWILVDRHGQMNDMDSIGHVPKFVVQLEDPSKTDETGSLTMAMDSN